MEGGGVKLGVQPIEKSGTYQVLSTRGGAAQRPAPPRLSSSRPRCCHGRFESPRRACTNEPQTHLLRQNCLVGHKRRLDSQVAKQMALGHVEVANLNVDAHEPNISRVGRLTNGLHRSIEDGRRAVFAVRHAELQICFPQRHGHLAVLERLLKDSLGVCLLYLAVLDRQLGLRLLEHLCELYHIAAIALRTLSGCL